MSEFSDFDPNKPDLGHPWATYIPHWRPGMAFKTHRQRGHALSRVTQNRQCKLYTLRSEGGWDEVLVKDNTHMPEHCDGCGHTMLEFVGRYDYQRHQRVPDGSGKTFNAGKQYLVRERNRIVDPLRLITLCPQCARGMGYA